jgi:hypothetical protein
MPKKLTKEIFIDKSILKHGDVKYNYSKVNYINDKTNVIIICNKHGEFLQRPNNHMQGQGCPKCGDERVGDFSRSNINDFIKNVKLIHKDKYDYSKAEYINTNTKIIITCPEHGEFLQTPEKHLIGQGCPECGVTSRVIKTTKSKDWFIKLAIKKHKNKYDYSKINYVNTKTKVRIICHKHGEFLQSPEKHMFGQGCHKCGDDRVSKLKIGNKEDFIKKSKLVHDKNLYDYSKVIYTGVDKKVIIICIKHGEFLQTPGHHMCGKGCSKCGDERVSKSLTLNIKDFKIRAKKIHNNKYDYSKSNYIQGKIKTIITCPKHGDFLQSPQKHLSRQGCRKCRSIAVGDARRGNTEEFIKKAKKIHGNKKYDYSKVDYVLDRKPVIIICKNHGEFSQKPAHHLRGSGCPKCNESKGEKSIAKFLDLNKINYIRQAKFSLCKNKFQLPFDFYLPNYNYCIEFDGDQHFNKSNYWFSNTISINDAIKTKFCRDNDINLLRIHYKDFNNIDKILSESLKVNFKQISNNFI